MKPFEDELKLMMEASKLYTKLQSIRDKMRQVDLTNLLHEVAMQVYTQIPRLSPVHNLRAHVSKVHDVVWGTNDKYILTVGADGCIIVWDTQSGLIHNIIDVSAFQPVTAVTSEMVDQVFCGGLCANVVLLSSRHQSPEDGYSVYETNVVYEHSGQVSCIIPLEKEQILTAALSDGALLWDVEKVQIISRFSHPTTNVKTMCKMPNNSQLFLTGSTDGTVRQWDTRQPKNETSMFEPHQAEINCLTEMPFENNFVSGSEDTYIHLYDTRTDVALAKLCDPKLPTTLTSQDTDVSTTMSSEDAFMSDVPAVCDMAVSTSGRILISGCKDSMIYFWDLAQPHTCMYADQEVGPVMRVAMSYKKNALALVTWGAKPSVRIMRPK